MSILKQVCKSDGLILYAGGVGLSACLPYVRQAAIQQPQVPCTMFWMIRDAGEPICGSGKVLCQVYLSYGVLSALLDVLIDQLRPIADQLAQIHDMEKADRCCITINIHLTSEAHALADSELPMMSTGEIDSGSPLLRVQVLRHRVDLSSTGYANQLGFDEERRRRSRLTVFSCGPASLCDDVRREARLALAAGDWHDVGYVEECFSW